MFSDGKTDITLYKITGPRFVKEIYRGDAWKGNALVYGEIMSILNQLMGQDVGSILKERYNTAYIDFISDIKFALKMFGYRSNGKMNVRFPRVSLQALTTESLRELVSHSSFNEKISITGDKLIFTEPFFRSLLESAINYASEIFDKCIFAITKEYLSEFKTLFVYGDCSDSPIFSDVVKQKFEPLIEVIVPNVNTPVLDGALMCGFQ